jgi:hypothetical protein
MDGNELVEKRRVLRKAQEVSLEMAYLHDTPLSVKRLYINLCRFLFISSIGLGFLTGCSSLQPVKVQTGSELIKNAKLVGRTTYRFLPSKTMAAAEAVSNMPYWHEQVGKAIAKNLSEKGYKQVENSPSDLLVAYHLVLKRSEAAFVFNAYSGYNLSPSEIAKTNLDKFIDPNTLGDPPVGLVAIDVIDPTRRLLLWRGWGKTSLADAKDTDRLTAIIKTAVDRTLANLPPRS